MRWQLKKSRASARIWLIFFASVNRFLLRYLPSKTTKILIPTQLLLGDSILMLSLIEKALLQYPQSELVIAAPSHAIAVLSKLNLPVTWIAWTERSIDDLQNVRAHGPFKSAYIPFEKWGSIWACAFNARKTVGFTFPGTRFHDWFLTKVLPLPATSIQISDWLMNLIPGENPQPYISKRELFTTSSLFLLLETVKNDLPVNKKVILHIGARNENRRWLAKYWSELAQAIRASDIQVVWTYAANEAIWSDKIRKSPQDLDTKGKLSFDELIALIAHVDAVVSPDTGVTHLCKLTGTPNVVIYGQGNPAIHGNGQYWKLSPVRNIFLEPIPCRSNNKIFGREIKGVKRCDFGPKQCANPFCQNSITPNSVMQELKLMIDI